MGIRTIPQSNSPVLQTGKLRHRIQISALNNANQYDTSGGWTTSGQTVIYTTWASIEALSAMEKFAAHEFVSQVTHQVIIRHPRGALVPGINAGMQVLFNGRTFQIEGVLNPDERKKMLMLMCIEINDSTQQTLTAAESTI